MARTPTSSYQDLSAYQSILVIKLGALGDMVQAMGAFKRLRALHPDAQITLMTTKGFKNLAEDCGYFDDIYIDPRPKWWQFKALRDLKMFLREGQNGRGFERVYDLQNNDRTKLYFRLAPRDIEWVGTARGASHRDPASKEDRRVGHIFDRLKETLARGGVTDITIDRLDWMQGDIEALRLPAKYVILVPGCAPSRPEKRWVTQRYIELAARLTGDGFTPVVIGTEAERDVTADIKKGCPYVIDLTGKTSLYQLAALGRGAVAAIGNDTGPMHILGPVGCSCIILYPASSNAVRYRPLGKDVQAIQKSRMADITVDEVYTRFQKALSENAD